MAYSQFYALRGQIPFNGYFAHVSIVGKQRSVLFFWILDRQIYQYRLQFHEDLKCLPSTFMHFARSLLKKRSLEFQKNVTLHHAANRQKQFQSCEYTGFDARGKARFFVHIS